MANEQRQYALFQAEANPSTRQSCPGRMAAVQLTKSVNKNNSTAAKEMKITVHSSLLQRFH